MANRYTCLNGELSAEVVYLYLVRQPGQVAGSGKRQAVSLEMFWS